MATSKKAAEKPAEESVEETPATEQGAVEEAGSLEPPTDEATEGEAGAEQAEGQGEDKGEDQGDGQGAGDDAEKGEGEQPPAEVKAPQASSLEPPAPPAPDEPPADLPTVADLGASLVERAAEKPQGPRIYDAATGACPDPDTVFERIHPQGTVFRCLKRLHERVLIGPFGMETDQLLIPAGAEVNASRVNAVTAVLRELYEREQAAAAAEAGEATDEGQQS